MAKHLVKRFQKRAGHERGKRKDGASTNLSPAQGRAMAKHLAKRSARVFSVRERSLKRPCRPETKLFSLFFKYPLARRGGV